MNYIISWKCSKTTTAPGSQTRIEVRNVFSMHKTTPIKRQYIDLSSLMTRIRTRLVERGSGGVKGIGRLYQVARDNPTEMIDLAGELPKLMNDIGVILNKTELNELIRLLDCDGTGRITYDEFLFQMAPPLNQTRINSVNKAFDQLDADGSGRVAIRLLESVHNPASSEMVRMGKTTGKEILGNLMASYDRDSDGLITREEFIDYYREISPSIDNDEYFTLMIKLTWNVQ